MGNECLFKREGYKTQAQTQTKRSVHCTYFDHEVIVPELDRNKETGKQKEAQTNMTSHELGCKSRCKYQ